ncbi:DUF1641 domain-containing protein [Paenibacillus validus]|nr:MULTISPECIES: DUF1641 domain-containing protein [Paenibacillus]MED4601540.1 DUF1641 domain-containing protein [Paenibacillus validus]MED4604703.1 DUF1641 domain-containing protein [Paenibacillus validus]
MARAITDIDKPVPDQEEETAQAIRHMMKEAANRTEPLVKVMSILDELNRLGILDAVEGLLKNSKQIAAIGMEQMNKPGAHRMIKNGMGAVQLLTQLDPAKLGAILQGLSEGVNQAVRPEPDPKQGLWGIVQSLRKPEVRVSLSMMMGFLQGMGKGLSKKSP